MARIFTRPQTCPTKLWNQIEIKIAMEYNRTYQYILSTRKISEEKTQLTYLI
jgi:hypothetical protein